MTDCTLLIKSEEQLYLIFSMVSFLIIIACVVGFAIFYSRQRKSKNTPIEFPITWKHILNEKVLFYHNLNEPDKKRFEQDIMRFISNVRITGIRTDVDITD